MPSYYLNQVCSMIRFREARPQVLRELQVHWDEIIDECQAQGMGEAEATKMAERRMGDPCELGRQLDQINRPQFDGIMSVLTGALLVCGLLMVWYLQSTEPRAIAGMFSHTILAVLAGIVVVAALYFFDYFRLGQYSQLGLWVTLAFCLGTLGFAAGPNQGDLMNYGSPYFYFIEYSPWLFILLFAGIFSRPTWKWNAAGFLKALLWLALPNFYYLLVNQFVLQSIVLYTSAFLVLAWFSGAGWKKNLALGSLVVVPLLAESVLEPWRLYNILGFLNPEADAEVSGWIYLQIRQAVESNLLWGSGANIAEGIPMRDSSMIFLYIIHTFGWLAGIALALLAFALIIRLLQTSARIYEPFGKLLVVGISWLLLVQFSWNIFMNLGFVPVSALLLPFVSYDPASIILMAVTIGLVMSVNRRRILDRTVLG